MKMSVGPMGLIAGLIGASSVRDIIIAPIKWNLRPSPPRPEGEATPEQKAITLHGRRGKGTRRQRKNRK